MSDILPRWALDAQEDVFGQDRLVRSLLRVVARVPAGAVVGVHGAPGSGRDEFVRRVAWLAGPGRGRSEAVAGIHPRVVWFDAWSWCKQGHVATGVVAATAADIPRGNQAFEKALELGMTVARMQYDGGVPETPGVALNTSEIDPVAAVGQDFARVVEVIRGGRSGRIVLVVDGADRLAPAGRRVLLDSLRVLLSASPELVAIISIGQESALDALRDSGVEMDDTSARRVLEDLFDLSITVPNLEVRRIGTLLRDYIGPAESTVRRSFGREALTGITAAVAHRPLGSPRFLQRLAWRTVLLAEFAAEIRATRVLSEAQWAWVIISERWPDFRRFMIRGGRQRWVELARAVQSMQSGKPDLVSVRGPGGPVPLRSGIGAWLEGDLILADYLRLHAEGFARDGEGIFWLENLMLAAGL